MITKIFILFVMLIIVGALISSLLSLVKDTGDSKRTVKALTLRIGTSLTLFVCLLVAFKLGLIKPHGI